MPKEKKSASKAQGVKAAEAAVENGQKTKPFELGTTDGNLLKSVTYRPDKQNHIWVNAVYVEKQKDKSIETRLARPLSEEQAREMFKLPEDQRQDFAVRAAFPMFVDGKAFNQTAGEIDGEAFDYAFTEKVTEDVAIRRYAFKADGVNIATNDTEKIDHYRAIVAALPEEERSEVMKNVGKVTANIGVKGGEKHSTFMTVSDLQSIRLRADVKAHTEPDETSKKPDAKKVVIDSVGAPMTKAAILMRAVKNGEAYRAQVDKVSKMDWSKYKLPAGVQMTGARLYFDKNYSEKGQAHLQAKINGAAVTALLSRNETLAVRNNIISFEQAAMANRDFAAKVMTIAGLSAGVEQHPGMRP